MTLVKPSAEILMVTPDASKIIEQAGRVCYKSEDRIAEQSAIPFIKGILKAGHESVIEHASATVRFITDRGVSHEIVRHRMASYSQESTRYVNYGKTEIKFIIPGDFELDADDLWLLDAIEKHYNQCLWKGRTPQQARYFLPNGVKTELIMTCNMREWRHFFQLRTPKPAHPQMRELVIPLLEEFKKQIPVIFDDIEVV